MQYFILADPEKCIGCRTCALACSFEHEEVFIPVLSRITPLWIQEAGRFVPFTCQQCSEPLCAAVCPRSAITVDPQTGAKIVDAALCIGCHSCFYACPFGIPAVHPAKHRMFKCNLCGGSPRCVEECPREALSLCESDEAAFAKRRKAVKTLMQLMEKIE